MEHNLKVGDKVLNVEYLKYIGVKDKWRAMNMQPFQEIKAIGECRPWMDTKTCFAMAHSDVKYLANIPMHRNKIFDIETGFDMDRQLERFLPIKTHNEEIQTLVKTSVEKAIEKGNSFRRSKIERLEREIKELKQEIEDHVEFCNECGDYILSECEKY